VISALYEGPVTHARTRPRRHRLRYRMFMALLDLDEIDGLRLRWFSRNRFNLLSFHDADHGDGSGDLRGWAEAAMRQAGIEPDGGPIRLLAMPRVLGHAFNPISLFYCHGRDGGLRAIVHQVNNTFGERHSYVIPAEADADGVVRQRCDKGFYVSPFLPMDLRYDFTIRPPAEATSLAIAVSDAEGVILHAAFAGERKPLTDAAILSAWLRHPLLSLKVLAGIHWEALFTWLKGARFHRRPPAPPQPVTAVRAPEPLPKRRAA
jgi:DUF1365 family protein